MSEMNKDENRKWELFLKKYFRELRHETRIISLVDLNFQIYPYDEYSHSTLNVSGKYSTFTQFKNLFIFGMVLSISLIPSIKPANEIHTILCKMKTAITNMVHRLERKRKFHLVHHDEKKMSYQLSVCLRSKVCICLAGKFFLLFRENLQASFDSLA